MPTISNARTGKILRKESGSKIPAGVLLTLRTMMDNGVTKRRGESMTFEGKEYDVGRLLDALEEGNGDANPMAVFLFFFL